MSRCSFFVFDLNSSMISFSSSFSSLSSSSSSYKSAFNWRCFASLSSRVSWSFGVDSKLKFTSAADESSPSWAHEIASSPIPKLPESISSKETSFLLVRSFSLSCKVSFRFSLSWATVCAETFKVPSSFEIVINCSSVFFLPSLSSWSSRSSSLFSSAASSNFPLRVSHSLVSVSNSFSIRSVSVFISISRVCSFVCASAKAVFKAAISSSIASSFFFSLSFCSFVFADVVSALRSLLSAFSSDLFSSRFSTFICSNFPFPLSIDPLKSLSSLRDFSRDKVFSVRSFWSAAIPILEWVRSSSRDCALLFKSASRFSLLFICSSTSCSFLCKRCFSMSLAAICFWRSSFSSLCLNTALSISCSLRVNASLASASSFNFFCRTFLSSTTSFRDFSFCLHSLSRLAILVFCSFTTLSISEKEIFDFLISWFSERSNSSFWASSLFHLYSLSLASFFTEANVAFWDFRFVVSSLFSAWIWRFSSSAFFKRFSRSLHLVSAILKDFFSSSNRLTQAVRSDFSCWLW